MSDKENLTPETPRHGFTEANSAALNTPAPEEEKDENKKEKKKKTWKQELLEWVITLIVALVIAFVVRSFIFEPVFVDGNSMYPTLRDGEIMYVSKTSYGAGFIGIPFTDIGTWFNVGGNPERYDVVVCHYEIEYDEAGNKLGGYNVVKRVVGLPGDTVMLRNGRLVVTDKTGRDVSPDEDFIYHTAKFDFGPVTVPEGEYFLMGDNRNNSLDSREKGTVKRSEIIGRVEAVIWHAIPNRLDDQYGLKVGR